MTTEQLEIGSALHYEIKDFEHAISALEKMQDKHGQSVNSCFLVPNIKDAMLNVLNVRLKILKSKFDQL